MIWLLFLTIPLTTSIFMSTTPGFFFYFVLTVATLSTGIASYLQSSIAAVAALFGPEATQAVMSGQAAVAVAMSAVQVISILLSLSGGEPPALIATSHGRTTEEKSVCAFFTLSACFLATSIFAHRILMRTPQYKVLVAPLDSGALTTSEAMGEQQALLAMSGYEAAKDRIFRVIGANMNYEIAVAYVGVVSLVGFYSSLMLFAGFQCFATSRHRQSSLLSQLWLCLTPQVSSRTSSTLSTSSSSTLATSSGAISALSLAFLLPLPLSSSYYPLGVHCSSPSSWHARLSIPLQVSILCQSTQTRTSSFSCSHLVFQMGMSQLCV
jgi:hypothetical protein